MSILEKCHELGEELRNCEQGKRILELYEIIKANHNDLYIFHTLINRYYTSDHFYAPMHALMQIRANKENESAYIRTESEKVEEIPEVQLFAEACLPFGKICNNISFLAFGNKVMYSMPDNLIATPKAIRLLNRIAVEALRFDYVKDFIFKFSTEESFRKLTEEYSDLVKRDQISPYTKKDRKILRRLRMSGHSKDDIEILYGFFALTTFIRSMLFDGFFGNVYVVDENRGIKKKREFVLNGACYMVIELPNSYEFIGPTSGWLLKYIKPDGSVLYGQLFEKTFCLVNEDKEKEGTTICALVFPGI